MLRTLPAAIISAMLSSPVLAIPFDQAYPDVASQLPEEDLKLVKDLDFQQGEIIVGNGLATLNVNADFYFLNPAGTSHVLETMWGNPPDDSMLGMIFPADSSPFDDDGWGMTIHYEDIGYVDDKDAMDQDYDEILEGLQEEARASNAWRIENGYDKINLIGWAEPPSYDADNKVLYWAKELQFGGYEDHTLNYNMRVLGRRGVLVQNFIAGMGDLERVNADIPAVIKMTSFNDGNSYAEFDPSSDKVAAVGLGGLVAGKVLAKTGVLAVILLFLKKAWFLLLLPLIWLKNLFFNKKTKD
jgi:uncharacterized membrane-anchored protein